jgi:hypothetical protein
MSVEKDEEAKKVYHTGDFRAYSLGEEFEMEHWWNPALSVIEAFVGVVFSSEGNEPCEKKYPRDAGEHLPQVVYKEELDDGRFVVKFRQKTRPKWYVDYRVAAGAILVPIAAWVIGQFIKRNRK